MNTSFIEHLTATKANPVFSGSLSLDRKTNTTTGTNSVAIGQNAEASGNYSSAIGQNVTSSGFCSFSEGVRTSARGSSSHAEGSETEATGGSSHAEGNKTTASTCAHSEGYKTSADGNSSHSEGSNTLAFGGSSHAEGSQNSVFGFYGHVEGHGNIAADDAQHVFGTYNIPIMSKNPDDNPGDVQPWESNTLYNPGDCVEYSIWYWYCTTEHTSSSTFDSSKWTKITNTDSVLEIVGNGTSNSSRSNARTLDVNGNEILAGKLTVGAGPTDNMDVATKQYVDNFVKSGSMIFKGTIGSSGATVDSLPQNHEAGWMYLVSTAGTYLNKTCEVGDMIVCVRTSNGNLSTDWTIIQNNINPELYATKEYADAIKTNPSFTGNMTVSGKITIGSGPFDSTDAATKQYVDNTFINKNAVLYKGVISSASDLPSTHHRGWLYLVSTAGEYAGKTCEIGDMILCTQQGIDLQSNSHWTVIQNNIDTTNMVTHSSNDLVANEQLAVFDGTSGKIIKGGLLGNNVADKSYVDTKFSSIVVPTLVAGDNVSFRTGDNSITISSSVPSTYATKDYVDTGIQNIDLSAYAPKANPEFSGSISLSRQDDSTVGANSLAVGTGTEATELCSQAVGFYTKATGQFQHVSGKYNAVDSIITQHDETATYYSGKYVYVRGRYRDNNTWYYVLNIYKCTAYHTGDTPTSEGSLPSSHWAYVYGIDSTSQPQLPFNTINAEIVGIGSDDGHRKNGRTLDWNGNEWLAGRLTVGAGPVSNMDVTTKQYVDSAIQTAGSTYATKASPVFTGSITIGGTSITEAQLQALVAIANDDPIGTTWVFNDEITFPSDDLFIENTDGLFYFGNNDTVAYYSISIDKSSADSPKITYHDQFGDETAYMFGVWNSNDYKTITFTEYIDTATPSIKAFMTWLRANATKAGDATSATGVSF